jgi:hypothetical protein
MRCLHNVHEVIIWDLQGESYLITSFFIRIYLKDIHEIDIGMYEV